MKKVFLVLILFAMASLSFGNSTEKNNENEASPMCGIGMYGECNDGSTIQFTSWANTCAEAYTYGQTAIAVFCSHHGGVNED